MMGSYLADDVPPQPDECTCEGQPRHIHHPWAWREAPTARSGGDAAPGQNPSDRADHHVIACNFAEPAKVASKGALAYVLTANSTAR